MLPLLGSKSLIIQQLDYNNGRVVVVVVVAEAAAAAVSAAVAVAVILAL
jgi:hypothetical protein